MKCKVLKKGCSKGVDKCAYFVECMYSAVTHKSMWISTSVQVIHVNVFSNVEVTCNLLFADCRIMNTLLYRITKRR